MFDSFPVIKIDFLECNRLCTMLIVIGQHQLIIIHKYRVGKGVDQSLLKFPIMGDRRTGTEKSL